MNRQSSLLGIVENILDRESGIVGTSRSPNSDSTCSPPDSRCIDCGMIIQPVSKRCWGCRVIFLKGKRKVHRCNECGKEVGYYSKLCIPCYRKEVKEKAYKWRCKDCGVKVAFRCERCALCQRKFRHTNRRIGQCMDCGKEIHHLSKRCLQCYKNFQKKNPVRYYCVDCGKPSVWKRVRCRGCLYEDRRSRMKKGSCKDCGGEIYYLYQRCPLCHKKWQRKRTKEWWKDKTYRDKMSKMSSTIMIRGPTEPQIALYDIVHTIDESFILEGSEGWRPITVSKNPFRARKPDIVSFKHRIIVEFDGFPWHEGQEFRDKFRDIQLEAVGYKVLHFGYNDLKTPEKIQDRVSKLLTS